ncbi:hypothetical protein [Sagittula sp. S175]|uniref:hypothetical protein n=1 Tax=Sagittula sp. S175 TaxID=3415129 RepID=UPI003C7A37CB
MTPSEVETVYEALARRLDTVGPERRELFLAKLALLLAHEVEDTGQVLHLIEDASEHLDT